MTFLLGFLKWMEEDKLIPLEEVDGTLGLTAEEAGKGLSTEIEDYIFGLCLIPGELSRLCINRATSGDYATILRIVKFVNELYAGLQLLNFKNDYMRKKFDSIKYDLKKIEEVVYDLSIRGLLKQ